MTFFLTVQFLKVYPCHFHIPPFPISAMPTGRVFKETHKSCLNGFSIAQQSILLKEYIYKKEGIYLQAIFTPIKPLTVMQEGELFRE